jgi:hypothetical protein
MCNCSRGYASGRTAANYDAPLLVFCPVLSKKAPPSRVGLSTTCFAGGGDLRNFFKKQQMKKFDPQISCLPTPAPVGDALALSPLSNLFGTPLQSTPHRYRSCSATLRTCFRNLVFSLASSRSATELPWTHSLSIA